MNTDKIKVYCEKKEEEKALKKSLTSLNNEIKTALQGLTDKALDFGKYHVSLQSRVTESPDEDKMVDVLKTFWKSSKGKKKCPFIRTVEYVDMDLLENAIYKGELPDEVIRQLDGCRIRKETTALVYSIDKEED